MRRRRPPVRGAGLAVAAWAGLVGLARLATAQAQPAPVPADGLVRTECRGQLIDEIVMVSKPPLFRARLPDFVPNARAIETFVGQAQTRFHSASQPEAVRPFLQLREGDRCDERRRAESERILRAQSYIADARLAVYRRNGTTVVLIVETTDEVAVIADVRPRPSDPYIARMRLGSGNVYGLGIRAVAGFTDGAGFRNGWSAEVTKFAVLGRPVMLSALGARDPLATRWVLDAARPFFTDFQRYAWAASAGGWDGYFNFRRRDSLDLSLPVDRRWASIGGLTRIGPPGKLFLVGSSLTYERDVPDAQGVTVVPGEVRPVIPSPANDRYRPTRSVRANALLGWRRLRFLRVAGFDAVEGLQDVRIGFELGGTVGRGLPALGSDDADWFASVGMNGGLGDDVRYVQAGATWESRFAPETGRLDATVASGRITGYWRLSAEHTLVSDVDVAWGRRNRTPFQLTLDDRDAGVRGFRQSREAGGARAVWRLEDRWYLGRVRNVVSLAVAPFTDVGRLWAGDVPYGRTTAPSASFGVALLAAVPPASQVTWRLEVARRLTTDPFARGWDVRVVIRDVGRQFWREPRDVARSRPVALPTSLFTWP